jgi:hypothetical protein
LNGDAHSSTVIDAAAGKLITNIPLGGKPEYGASAGDGKLYTNLTDTSEVVEIDTKRAAVARRWPMTPCKQPVAMAIDTAHHRLFSGCRSFVMAVSDYQAGKLLITLPIGVDGAGYDAASGDAFASNTDGTLTVIHQDSPDQYHVLQNLETPRARVIWDSIRRTTACSSPPPNSGRHPLPAGGGRCCRAPSCCSSSSALRWRADGRNARRFRG